MLITKKLLSIIFLPLKTDVHFLAHLLSGIFLIFNLYIL